MESSFMGESNMPPSRMRDQSKEMVQKLFLDDVEEGDYGNRSRSRDNSKTIGGRNISKNSAESRGTLAVKKPAASEEMKHLDMTIDEIIENQAFIWCCGKNTDGELGLGNEDRVNLPKNVGQLRDFQVRDIAASNTHTVLMTPGGGVHVSGSTLHGKCGIEKIQTK